MPKSKKKKNNDFQKVKLKVGKKLSKGDNITNLSFKTRQIQITQRIKDGNGEEPVSKRKLSAQDLFRQCDHHSSSARVNAVAGLKELWLNNHEELMLPFNVHGFGSILQKLATLFIDNEAVVRHSVILTFQVIVRKISSGKKQPPQGFPMLHIHTYLCCAMNHVHEDIKLDSLLVLDTLMECFPMMLVEQTGDILNNLLSFISAPISIGSRGDSTTQRLSLNPESKVPIMVFRCGVLTRIQRIFMAALEQMEKQGAESPDGEIKQNQPIWSIYRDCHGRVTQDTIIRSSRAQGRFKSLFSGASHELGSYITKSSSLETFVQHSVPILLQCWKEARASVDSLPTSGNHISRESAQVMELVVSIIQLSFVLCVSSHSKTYRSELADKTLVAAEILVEHHASQFEKILMTDFPYSVRIQASGGKRKKKKETDTTRNSDSVFCCIELNLGLCEIMSCLCRAQSFQPRRDWLVKIRDHVKEALSDSPSVRQSTILARILTNFFMNPYALDDFIPVFRAAMDYFSSCGTKSNQKKIFYNVLALISRSWDRFRQRPAAPGFGTWNTQHSALVPVIEEFLSVLPNLLVDVVGSKLDQEWALDILALLTRARAQNCEIVSVRLHNSLGQILDPDTGVVSSNNDRLIQSLSFLLSMGTTFTRENHKQILAVIRKVGTVPRRKSWSITGHIIDAMSANIQRLVPFDNLEDFNAISAEQRTHLSEYFRFMLSLQLGMLKEELDQVSPVTADIKCDGAQREWWDVVFTLRNGQWDRHVEIAKLVTRKLGEFYIPPWPAKGYNEPFSFMDDLEQEWMKCFASRPTMPILSAYSLLQLVINASRPHSREHPSPKFYTFASNVVASVLAGMHDPHNSSGLEKDMVWQIKEDVLCCLRQDSPFLDLTWTSLHHRSQDTEDTTDSERQAVSMAKEFLLSDPEIRQQIQCDIS